MKPHVLYQDWGQLDYKMAWDRQTSLHQQLVKQKKEADPSDRHGYFVLCEHPPVYTLGKSGSEDHLLISKDERIRQGLAFYKINRGGDITHHGPGQIVGYPILDLEHWYRDVHRYVRNIEEVIIKTLKTYGIESERVPGFTGVWTRSKNDNRQKLCAIGVHLSRWVSMHGFALNVNNDIDLFRHIVPCGIQEEGMDVTSMQRLLGEELNLNEVKSEISTNFAEIFDCELNTEAQ